MKKYDGWVVKDKGNCLWIWTFAETRSELIKRWGEDDWKRLRKKGEYEAVKVKFVEVGE